jgi:glycosyltransferase A (GT-A) superfamily protein (DUF2064 family)
LQLKDGAILIFARRPELGFVKKRLAACIGEALTLQLYQAFLRDTLEAARECGARVLLAHTAGSNFPEQGLADIAFEQHGASFGERFDSALRDVANMLPTGTPIVLIGADTPHLSPKSMALAFHALNDAKAVIGPSANGGFYILGFSTFPVSVAEAFNRPSSTEVHEVVRLLCEANIKPKLLQFWFDVDMPDDLVKLNSFIDLLVAVNDEWVPHRTLAVLRDKGLIECLVQHQKGECREQRQMLASPSLVSPD